VAVRCLFQASTCFEHCCAHHKQLKIVLYSIWYHHTYRWPSRVYFKPLYVSSTVVLIIRSSKLYYTASGIITPIGGRPVFIWSLYMFRALLCSSSGAQNCIIQHLVSSHSVVGRPVHRLCTGRPPTVGECDTSQSPIFNRVGIKSRKGVYSLMSVRLSACARYDIGDFYENRSTKSKFG